MTIFVSGAKETLICLCWWCMFSLSPDDEVGNLPWRAWWPCLSGYGGLWTASTPRAPCCSHCRARGGEKPCSLEYVGKITHSYERFHTSCCISLCSFVPEMPDWNISLGLHFTPKNAFGCIHSRTDQSQCLLFIDMTLLPQGCFGQCEIKEKYTPPASIALNTHSLLKACLCCPEDSDMWKHCTNKHTALINILYITGCWKLCWLP